jgi:hypothetical protein
VAQSPERVKQRSKLEIPSPLLGGSRTLFLATLPASMPPITALLHTTNDGRRLGRTLETLRPCREIVIVDHASVDNTRRIAREYGARLVAAESSAPPGHYLQFARNDWILCLDPRETLTEDLEASLFEWTSLPPIPAQSRPYSVLLTEQVVTGWLDLPEPHTRLIPRHWSRWQAALPAPEPSAIPLQGRLLRFVTP